MHSALVIDLVEDPKKRNYWGIGARTEREWCCIYSCVDWAECILVAQDRKGRKGWSAMGYCGGWWWLVHSTCKPNEPKLMWLLTVSLALRSKVIRKSIARVLTVYNQTQRVSTLSHTHTHTHTYTHRIPRRVVLFGVLLYESVC
jgi:hypothetical protein